MTPAEIAANSSCFRCISNYEASLLYLLGQIAGMADPAVISANAVCFDCISNKEASILYLLDQIVTGGGGGGGSDSVTCGAVPPVAAPAGACGIYYDTVTQALYIWDGAAWILKA